MEAVHRVSVRRTIQAAQTAELESFPRRQAIWVLLNSSAAVGLLILHFVFAPIHPIRSPQVVGLLLVGVVVQAVDAAWLYWRKPPLWLGRMHVWGLVYFTLLLSFLLSMASPVGDIQFSLIMILPVVAVSFRKSPWVGLSVGAAAGVLTLCPPGIYLMESKPVQLQVLFDAMVLAMVDVIVALVVWIIANALRREAAMLKNSLTALEETQAQLALHERLAIIGEFAASIAHEIRNPVAMISSSLDLASREDSPEEVRREMSKIAREEAMRLSNLTGDFLAYARSKPAERKAVGVEGVLGYVAGLVRARAAEAGVRTEVRCEPNLTAEIDEFQIHRALLNLVTNALDATPSGGVIVIGARRVDGGVVELFVENTGPAVPTHNIGRIFEPFFTSRVQGTGLGLPIALSIARGHGGDLQLSENVDGRVRFTLLIPPIEAQGTGNGVENVARSDR
jgi:signal transduction histidine kinase